MTRDLDHLSAEQLSERMHDCINNLRTRTRRNKIGIAPADSRDGLAWITLFTEALEECKLRGYSYPGPISLASHRSSMDHALDPIPDLERALNDLGLGAKPYLLRFGERKWLVEALASGRLRVAPASYYESSAHNHARRDSELERHLYHNPRNPLGVAARGSIQSRHDYYLFSLCTRFSSRLFGDFRSDACLLIPEPIQFLQELESGLRLQLPSWDTSSTLVTYYDPVRVVPHRIEVPKFKSFKHAYQAELRVLSIPRDEPATLHPIYVDVPSLSRLAILVDLHTYPPAALPHDPTEDLIRSFGTLQKASALITYLPDAHKVQGILLDRSQPKHQDWFFNVQYTDANNTWHQVKVPISEALYLLNLLKAADKEQGLEFLGGAGRW